MSPETSFGGHNKKRSKHNKIWYYMAPKWWISIRNIIIYLETKSSPKSEDFCILVAIFGHHSKPKWSSYGAACLIPCKYPSPLKSCSFLNF
jgi:hypothetical protein